MTGKSVGTIPSLLDGNGNIGVEFRINEAWTVNAKYNTFFGPVNAGTGGLLKDRDNITMTVKRTF